MQRLIATLTTILVAVGPVPAFAYGSNDMSNQLNILRSTMHGNNQPLATFKTAQAAGRHCPKDTIVWLNTDSGIWYERNDAQYGHVRPGAFVCRKEAALAHPRRNSSKH